MVWLLDLLVPFTLMFDLTVWPLLDDLRGYMVSLELLQENCRPLRANKMAAMSTKGRDFFNMLFILFINFQVVKYIIRF